jgi:hypothetical protein
MIKQFLLICGIIWVITGIVNEGNWKFIVAGGIFLITSAILNLKKDGE